MTNHSYLLLASLLLLANTGQAAPLTVGYVDYPPCTYANPTEGGHISGGACIDITRAVLAEMGRDAEFIHMPPKRLLHSIANGQLDIAHLLMNFPLPQEQVLFSSAPIFITRLNAYSLAEQEPIDNVHDLEGQSVIILLGYSYGGIAKFLHKPESRVKTLTAKTPEAGLTMLQAKRASYLLIYQGAANEIMQEIQNNGLQQQTLMVTPITWAISTSTPDAEKLIQELNRTFQKLKQQNRLPHQLP